MQYCSQCGKQLSDKARYCRKCGADLNDETEVQSNIPPVSANQERGFPVKTKTIITGIVIALLLAAGGFWGWRSLGTEARVQQKLDLAVKYLSENKFEEAVLAYNDAIKIEPREVKAYQGLAKTYTIQGKYDDAKSTYERGVASVSAENKPCLRLGLAGMYIDKGDLQEAERYFQEIINQNKTYIDAYRGLAMVYQQQGNKDKARAVLEQGIKENLSDYNAYTALARFYADSGDQEKTLANIVKSLDLEVNQQEAYTILADLYKGRWSELVNKADNITGTKTAALIKFYAYFSDEKYSQALTEYKNSLVTDQNNLKAGVLAAICMLKDGEKEAASQLINKLVKAKNNSWIMADIARYYLLSGDNKLAATWANKSLAVNGWNIDAVKILTEIYIKDDPELTQITTTRLITVAWQPLRTLKQELIKNQIDIPVSSLQISPNGINNKSGEFKIDLKENQIQNERPKEINNKQVTKIDDLTIDDFTLNGIKLRMSESSVVNILGKPQSITSDQYFKYYRYPEMEIVIGLDTVFKINTTNENCKTLRNIHVGDSYDDLIRVYGKPGYQNSDYVEYEIWDSIEQYRMVYSIKNNLISKIAFYNGSV